MTGRRAVLDDGEPLFDLEPKRPTGCAASSVQQSQRVRSAGTSLQISGENIGSFQCKVVKSPRIRPRRSDSLPRVAPSQLHFPMLVSI